MKIMIKVGEVQLSYEEPVDSTDYPRLVAREPVGKPNDVKRRGDYLMEQIERLARTAARLHSEMYIPSQINVLECGVTDGKFAASK